MIDFKDCDYRYIGNNDKLYCKNKEGMDNYCDNCKENPHLNCDNYNPRKDFCLKFFEDNVSENYKVCKEYSEFSDKELSRKWSN